MTRGEIKTKARASARAYLGGADDADPVLLNDWVDDTTTDLCRATDECFISASTDIVALRAQYCLPDLYYIEAVEAVITDGSTRVLSIRTTSKQTAYSSYWRTSPLPPGDPTAVITEGAGDLLLYPTPAYSATAGLTLRGFGVVTNALWPLDAAQCPLPPRTHQTVLHGVVVRYFEWAGKMEQAAMWDRRYRYGKGHFESEMATITDSARSRTSGESDYRTPSGPMNL